MDRRAEISRIRLERGTENRIFRASAKINGQDLHGILVDPLNPQSKEMQRHSHRDTVEVNLDGNHPRLLLVEPVSVKVDRPAKEGQDPGVQQ